MHIFYTPDIHSVSYILSEEESKHCIKVLRLKKGDPLALIDGKGNYFEAVIASDHPKKCEVVITNVIKEYGKRDFHLHIAIAPTKFIERFEWFLEKATEIGINEITPLLCERSERKNINPERLNKIITAAVKQSETAYHPVLHEIISFNKFVTNNNSSNKFIAHCEDSSKNLIKNKYIPKEKTIILIGPEGDFSEKEITLAKENSYTEISLGNSRLRTETAGIVACHSISFLNF